MQKAGKESSQEGEERDRQAAVHHQPCPLKHSRGVEGASPAESLCNATRGVLIPCPSPLHLPAFTKHPKPVSGMVTLTLSLGNRNG